MTKIHLKSNCHDWETSQELFDLLDSIFHFTLDPCATAENAKCKKYYTIQDDGLSKSWAGERVFVNPPFGHQISKWVKKSFLESKNALVVLLLPVRTDTSYWHEYIFDKASVYFIKGRLYFNLHNEVSKWRSTFPAAIIVYDGCLASDRPRLAGATLQDLCSPAPAGATSL